MRWNVVMEALLGLVEADADVVSVIGDPPALFMVGERDHQVPSVQWSLLTDPQGEVWGAAMTQWDLFTKTVPQMVTLERGIRRVLHRESLFVVDGHQLISRLSGDGGFTGPRDGQIARRLDFRTQYIRRLAS